MRRNLRIFAYALSKIIYFFILQKLGFFYFICLDLFCIIIIIIIIFNKSRKWLGLGVDGLFSSSSWWSQKDIQKKKQDQKSNLHRQHTKINSFDLEQIPDTWN